MFVLLAAAWAITSTAGFSGIGPNDATKRSNYRIITDGNGYRVQSRIWPFWYSGKYPANYGTVAEAEGYIAFSIQFTKDRSIKRGPWKTIEEKKP